MNPGGYAFMTTSSARGAVRDLTSSRASPSAGSRRRLSVDAPGKQINTLSMSSHAHTPRQWAFILALSLAVAGAAACGSSAPSHPDTGYGANQPVPSTVNCTDPAPAPRTVAGSSATRTRCRPATQRLSRSHRGVRKRRLQRLRPGPAHDRRLAVLLPVELPSGLRAERLPRRQHQLQV